MEPRPEELPPINKATEGTLEQAVQPESTEATAEASKVAPETFEALSAELLKRAKEIGVAAVRDELAIAKVEYLKRSGVEAVDPMHAQAMAAVNALFADLESALHQHAGTTEPLADHPAEVEPPTATTATILEPVLKPLQPSIDGVRPPEAEAAGDDDEFIEEATATVEANTVTAFETVDPYAERNSASQALLTKLQEPDLSIPGHSNMELLKNVRELLIMRSKDRLVIRTDFEGNIVIGEPADDGNGLRTRLMTLHHDTDAGTVDWLRRSMRPELITLDRYKINVVDDPQLDHTKAALAA